MYNHHTKLDITAIFDVAHLKTKKTRNPLQKTRDVIFYYTLRYEAKTFHAHEQHPQQRLSRFKALSN